MDSGMFQKEHYTAARHKRAEPMVRRMGYELHVPRVQWSRNGDSLKVTVEMENRGVAPFYHRWQVQLVQIDGSGKIVNTQDVDWDVRTIMPGSGRVLFSGTQTLAKGGGKIALRVVNPLANGKPLRFANESQDRHANGCLTLFPIGEN
jgi:hypothetical protein